MPVLLPLNLNFFPPEPKLSVNHPVNFSKVVMGSYFLTSEMSEVNKFVRQSITENLFPSHYLSTFLKINVTATNIRTDYFLFLDVFKKCQTAQAISNSLVTGVSLRARRGMGSDESCLAAAKSGCGICLTSNSLRLLSLFTKPTACGTHGNPGSSSGPTGRRSCCGAPTDSRLGKTTSRLREARGTSPLRGRLDRHRL